MCNMVDTFSSKAINLEGSYLQKLLLTKLMKKFMISCKIITNIEYKFGISCFVMVNAETNYVS